MMTEEEKRIDSGPLFSQNKNKAQEGLKKLEQRFKKEFHKTKPLSEKEWREEIKTIIERFKKIK